MSERSELRVLVIVNRLFEWSQNFITRELCELRRQGVTVAVAARNIVARDDLGEHEQELEKDIILIPENPFRPSALVRHVLFKVRHMQAYLRAFGHLLRSGHSRPAPFFRSIVCFFRAASIAQEVKQCDFDLIHAHFMTAATETAVYLSIMTGIPFGCTSHAMDIYQDNSGQQQKIDRATYLITETRANVEYFLRTWRTEEGKIHQIYNSLPQTTLSRGHIKHDPMVFLAVGRLVEKKGFEYLLSACRILLESKQAFRCLLVGTGPLEQELQNRVRVDGLQAVVRFAGFIAPNEMAEQYANADVLVMPSVIDRSGDRDGLPTVLMEALYYGLPLICSRVSGLPECVFEGENGFIVPEKDGQALAQAMIRIMAEDYERMSRRSVQVAAELFDSAKNVARIKKIMIQAVEDA